MQARKPPSPLPHPYLIARLARVLTLLRLSPRPGCVWRVRGLRCRTGNCVSWSAEGMLAVVSGSTVWPPPRHLPS